VTTSANNDKNIVFGTFLPPFSTGIPGNFSQPKSLFKFASLSGVLNNLNIKSVEIKCADSNEPTENQIQQYWD
jgi:hypothetical protein